MCRSAWGVQARGQYPSRRVDSVLSGGVLFRRYTHPCSAAGQLVSEPSKRALKAHTSRSATKHWQEMQQTLDKAAGMRLIQSQRLSTQGKLGVPKAVNRLQ
eukprot:685102-Amphidinium_carterae.1